MLRMERGNGTGTGCRRWEEPSERLGLTTRVSKCVIEMLKCCHARMDGGDVAFGYSIRRDV